MGWNRTLPKLNDSLKNLLVLKNHIILLSNAPRRAKVVSKRLKVLELITVLS